MKGRTGVPLLLCTWHWHLDILAEWTGHNREDVGLFFWTKFVQNQKKLGDTSKINLNLYELSPAELVELLELMHQWSLDNLQLNLPKTWTNPKHSHG